MISDNIRNLHLCSSIFFWPLPKNGIICQTRINSRNRPGQLIKLWQVTYVNVWDMGLCIPADRSPHQRMAGSVKLAYLADHHLPFVNSVATRLLGFGNLRNYSCMSFNFPYIVSEHALSGFRNLWRQASSLLFFSCYLFNCQTVVRFCFKRLTVQNSVRPNTRDCNLASNMGRG